MDIITIIFSIIILITSIMFHELAHGIMADQLGDPTPRNAGRLTLNPIAHLEIIGSFIVPLLCIISGTGFIIGWAKPVPFNPSHFKNKRVGPALVAIAGPIMNIIIAIVFAVVFRLTAVQPGFMAFAQITVVIVMINVALAVFNLIPVPPLDGHHILGALFPKYRYWSETVMRSYGIILLILVLFFAGSFIFPVIRFFTNALLGF